MSETHVDTPVGRTIGRQRAKPEPKVKSIFEWDQAAAEEAWKNAERAAFDVVRHETSLSGAWRHLSRTTYELMGTTSPESFLEDYRHTWDDEKYGEGDTMKFYPEVSKFYASKGIVRLYYRSANPSLPVMQHILRLAKYGNEMAIDQMNAVERKFYLEKVVKAKAPRQSEAAVLLRNEKLAFNKNVYRYAKLAFIALDMDDPGLFDRLSSKFTMTDAFAAYDKWLKLPDTKTLAIKLLKIERSQGSGGGNSNSNSKDEDADKALAQVAADAEVQLTPEELAESQAAYDDEPDGLADALRLVSADGETVTASQEPTSEAVTDEPDEPVTAPPSVVSFIAQPSSGNAMVDRSIQPVQEAPKPDGEPDWFSFAQGFDHPRTNAPVPAKMPKTVKEDVGITPGKGYLMYEMFEDGEVVYLGVRRSIEF